MIDVLASSWASLVASYAPWQIIFFGTVAWGVSLLSLLSLPFAIVDLTGFPSAVAKQSIQNTKDKLSLYKKAAIAVPILVVKSMIAVAIITAYSVYTGRGIRVTPDLPTLGEFLRHFFIVLSFEETWFYFMHRLLHVPFLYKRFHKVHHEFTSPIAISAFYVHTAEAFTVHFVIAYFFPTLFGIHFITLLAWQLYILTLTVREHVGYKLPDWMPYWFLWQDPSYHDYHHEVFNCNFGNHGIWDSILGTGRDPRKEKERKAAEKKTRNGNGAESNGNNSNMKTE